MENNNITKKVAVCSCDDFDCIIKILSGCPIVRMGKTEKNELLKINITNNSNEKAVVKPEFCIGCGICVKKCTHNKVRMIDW